VPIEVLTYCSILLFLLESVLNIDEVLFWLMFLLNFELVAYTFKSVFDCHYVVIGVAPICLPSELSPFSFYLFMLDLMLGVNFF